MSRLRTMLHQIGGEAQPPPDDLADRALAQAGNERRRSSPRDAAAARRDSRWGDGDGGGRRRWARLGGVPAVVLAAASVGAVLVGVTVVVPSVTPEPESTSGAPEQTNPVQSEVVRFPDEVETLPSFGVHDAALVYQPGCKDVSLIDCERWRVVTVQGRHYKLPAPDEGGPATRAEVTVSPSGGRIGYLRGDGWVVLRELGSGEVTELFRRDTRSAGLQAGDIGGTYAWSADGRWLLSVPGKGCPQDSMGRCKPRGFDLGEHSMFVDTDSGKTVEIDDFASSIEMPNGTGAIVSDGGVAKPGRLGWVERRTGDLVEALPERLSPTSWGDGVHASVSPDGKTLAAVTVPDRGKRAGDALITITDLETGKTVDRYRFNPDEDWDSPRFLGWRDNNRVLVGTRSGKRAESGSLPKNVDVLDVRDGSAERVLRLPDGPERFRIAAGLF